MLRVQPFLPSLLSSFLAQALFVAAASADIVLSPPAEGANPDDPAAEIRQQQQQYVGQLESVKGLVAGNLAQATALLNVVKNAGGEGTSGEASPALKAYLGNPGVKKILAAATNPEIQSASNRVLEHPNRGSLVYFEIGWVVIFMIIQVWWRSKAESVLSKLSVTFASPLLYFGCAVFLVPTLVFGSAYSDVLSKILNVLVS